MLVNPKSVFNKPARRADWIDQFQAMDVINYVYEHPRKLDVFNTYLNNEFIVAIETIQSMQPEALARLLNSVSAFDQYEEVVLGQLALKVQLPALPLASFYYERVKVYVAFNLLEALKSLDMVNHREELVKETNEAGKPIYRTRRRLSFGFEDIESTYIHGLSEVPGTVLQKRFKVRAGGKALKLNKAEKDILRMAGSFKLRMIDIPRETFINYCKAEQDYINVELGKVKDANGRIVYDRIIANAGINQQADKYELIKQLDYFYLPMWMDYRTRLYYEFSEQYMAPSQAKWLYEAADPVKVTDQFRDDMKYSAVVIVDGRMSHDEAVAKYNSNPDYYQAKLRETVYTTREGKNGMDINVISYKETIYNQRLADAILADETRFLLGEDATNGGLQHGGIGFRSPSMMIPANVGGAPTQMDSHQTVADAFGLSRDDAKAINQQLLHGASLSGMAKRMGMSYSDMKKFVINAYGHEVLNIQLIADWGTMIHNNDNTSLMWTTRDGMRAQSLAYTTSTPITVYALSETNKSGYSQIKIHKEMPLILDATGKPIYGKLSDSLGLSDKASKAMGNEVKLRGTYANITHSIDATALRDVIRGLHAAGVKAALFIHDNFFVNERMDIVRHSYKAALLAEFEFSGYASAIADIKANYNGTCPDIKLSFGTATIDMIENSHFYLAA